MRYETFRVKKWTVQTLNTLESLIIEVGIEAAAEKMHTSLGSAESACKQHGIPIIRSKQFNK